MRLIRESACYAVGGFVERDFAERRSGDSGRL